MPLTDIESTPEERVDRLRQHKRLLEAEYDRVELSEAFSDKESRLEALEREHARTKERIEAVEATIPEPEPEPEVEVFPPLPEPPADTIVEEPTEEP